MHSLRFRRGRRRAVPIALVLLSGTGLALTRSLPATATASGAQSPTVGLLGSTVNTVNNVVQGVTGANAGTGGLTSVVGGLTGSLTGGAKAAAGVAAPVLPGPTPPAGERAATVYTNTGILLGGSTLIPAETSVCDTNPHPYVEPAAPPTKPTHDGSCIGNVDASPLAVLDLLEDTTTDAKKTASPTTKADSIVAGVRIGPCAVSATPCVDLIDVRVAESHTSATCTPAGATASASILFLSIAGNTVLDLSSNPGAQGPDNQVIDLTLAQIVLNYHTANAATRSAAAAPVVVSIPHSSPLSPLLEGTVYVSYTQSQLKDSDCTPPPPPPSACDDDATTPLDAEDTAVNAADANKPADQKEENETIDASNTFPTEQDAAETQAQHECNEEKFDETTPNSNGSLPQGHQGFLCPAGGPNAGTYLGDEENSDTENWKSLPAGITPDKVTSANASQYEGTKAEEGLESPTAECAEEGTAADNEDGAPATPTPTPSATPTPTPTPTATPTPTTCPEDQGENTNAAQNNEEDETGETAAHECSEESDESGATPTPETCTKDESSDSDESSGDPSKSESDTEESSESAQAECNEESDGSEPDSSQSADSSDTNNDSSDSTDAAAKVQQPDVQGQVGLAAILCLFAILGLAVSSRFIFRRR